MPAKPCAYPSHKVSCGSRFRRVIYIKEETRPKIRDWKKVGEARFFFSFSFFVFFFFYTCDEQAMMGRKNGNDGQVLEEVKKV